MEEQLVVLVDPWRDKYDRLLEAHEKLQKLNQNLEEKLLKLAEDHHAESTRLSLQAQELTQRLVEARLYIHQLEDENDRYRSDINVVVQLLHCKPSNFVSPKLETLPEDLQRKVLGQRNGSNCKKEKKIIKVQVPTFPPTDIMYAVDKGKGKKNGEKDIVSAAIMAKVLEERENERKENRKNRCKCASRIVLPTVHRDTQTLPVCTISYSDFNFSDFEEEDPDEVGDDDDEDDEDVCYDRETKMPYSKANASSSKCSSSLLEDSRHPPPPPSQSLCTTVDDIMKPDQKEEELLPTPLFRRKELKEDYKTVATGTTMTIEDSNNDHFTHHHQHHHNTDIHTRHKHQENQEHQQHHPNSSHQSFPSPSSMSSSASPVSSIDMPHSSSGGSSSHRDEGAIFNANSEGLIIGVGNGPPLAQGAMRISTSSSSSISSGNGNFNGNIINNCGSSISSSGGRNNTFSNGGSGRLPGRPMSMNFHKEREMGWERLNSSNSTDSSYRNGLVSHWRTTVLVHHPPKSHSYEPLTMTTTTGHYGEEGQLKQQTTFAATNAADTNEPLLDSPSDEQPLLMHCSGGGNYANTNNSNAQLVHSSQTTPTAQYYRAQKRTFWTRSSSTTSTETEI